jgi:hypothetical protein
MHRSEQRARRNGYSITSSARASSIVGTSMPSALAVLRLITSSNLRGDLDRKLVRLRALEDAVGVDRRTPIIIG